MGAADKLPDSVALTALNCLMTAVKREQAPAVKSNLILATTQWLNKLNDADGTQETILHIRTYTCFYLFIKKKYYAP